MAEGFVTRLVIAAGWSVVPGHSLGNAFFVAFCPPDTKDSCWHIHGYIHRYTETQTQVLMHTQTHTHP